jgi:hypothetical protein
MAFNVRKAAQNPKIGSIVVLTFSAKSGMVKEPISPVL